MREFTDQELVRREKAEKLFLQGIDAFGHRYERTAFAKEIKERFKDYNNEDLEDLDISHKVAGRIMFIRKMGKASFFAIQDKTDKIQVYISIN